MAGTFYEKGKVAVDRAIAADNRAWEQMNADNVRGAKQSFAEAYQSYGSAAECYLLAAKYEKNTRLVPKVREKAEEYITRADYMKTQMQNIDNGGAPTSNGNDNSAVAKKGATKKNEDKEENDKMRDALSGAIVREKPNVKWDDVAGLEGAKDALKEAVILPLKYPKLFTGKREPWKGILMYGPPGTGKSFLAKAIATEADSEFFSVSSADLVSKWQGESEKLVRELFKMARENTPSIIFIDEIDSLASSRSDSESESARRIKTEFLVQMQGVGKSQTGVLVLGATNIPWGLDSAIRRRFERRIYIPLPDVKARLRMFELNLGSTPHDVNPEEMQKLAEKSDGYSGSDIAILVRDAIMMPVRTLQSAQYFKKVKVVENGVEVEQMAPCSAGDSDPTKFEATLMDIKPDQLMVPRVTYFDFERALSKSKPSVSQGDLADHVKFTEEFGQEGN
mmetsp:Transcript_40768/g.161552  ORF Transcript_40768/g.161552 Transcript_40768/m.161552 type:complete len:451 (-) Transcript_40768:241-1593(-)|eukprot:CAMPEP_0113963090 /NCGR_PEP_ID=MMETSP0011_2-20120614/6310_1 /TAXON_ID=101924 /ORGANISM="Rhodosorus marinus" /LENGTH=450 /DNA_ID=CAMNT_0000975081 /DNA_START=201 /DNA_END=1553 /DNA_ORIENTATION=- /assembly_acc=CAM_ASM_000156